MSDTRPKKFMTPGAMSQAKEEQRPEPGQTDSAGRQQWQCKPPPTHPFCSVSVSPGGVSSPTYGLSEETLKALKITLPITPRIFVKNLAYGVNEAKLNKVFSFSGKIVQVTLYRHDNGETKGRASIEYAHPLEVIQTMLMFRDAKLLSRDLIIEQDKIGPQPIITSKLPDGLVNVKEGIGMGGSRLKVQYLNGDTIVHHPECYKQGSHPISERIQRHLAHEGNLGGVVRLESVFNARNARLHTCTRICRCDV